MLRSLEGLVLPVRCAGCARWGRTLLCAGCLGRVSWIGRDACRRCGSPAGCAPCAATTRAFSRAACAALYEGPARSAVVAFKVRGERRAAGEMAGWLLAPAALLPRPDAICWVPGTRRGEAGRGFTPTREIAAAFAARVGMRSLALLRKTRETSGQHGLGAAEREANLSGAFAATMPVAGGMLLVDDVLTTGATAHACARALLDAGAAHVNVLTIARAPLRRPAGRGSNSPFPSENGTTRMGLEGPSGSVVAAGNRQVDASGRQNDPRKATFGR